MKFLELIRVRTLSRNHTSLYLISFLLLNSVDQRYINDLIRLDEIRLDEIRLDKIRLDKIG